MSLKLQVIKREEAKTMSLKPQTAKKKEAQSQNWTLKLKFVKALEMMNVGRICKLKAVDKVKT